MIKERNYGIDLLRLILIFMVCVLHVLGQGGILDACQEGTIKFGVYWFFEIVSYCAVDAFAIISGYMATDKPKKYEKLIEMWFQVFFYSFILTFVFSILGINENWEKFDMIKCAMPVIFKKYWYFTAYFALFLSTPILNKFIFGLNDIFAKKTLIIIFALFSICGVISDPFQTHKGYSTIWLIILYLVGALCKSIKLFETKKDLILVIIWFLCILVTWISYVLFGFNNLISYVSPTILVSAIIMVIFFSRIKVNGNVVQKLSPLVFGVYLFQLNQVIWNVIIYHSFTFILSKSVLKGVIYVHIYAALIYIAGIMVEFIRQKIAKRVGIPSLSKKIVMCIDALIVKLFVFLK